MVIVLIILAIIMVCVLSIVGAFILLFLDCRVKEEEEGPINLNENDRS